MLNNNNNEKEYAIGNPIPMFSEELIKELDRDYPTKTYTPGISQAELWQYNGMRTLIEILLERMEGTNMEQLKGDMTINV